MHPVQTPQPTEAALRASISRHSGNATQRVPLQIALASRWRERGDYRRAGILLALTMGSAERSCGLHSLEVAAVCNEWGVLCKYTGRFDLSKALYRRALAICQHIFGHNHDTVATICHNLGG